MCRRNKIPPGTGLVPTAAPGQPQQYVPSPHFNPDTAAAAAQGYPAFPMGGAGGMSNSFYPPAASAQLAGGQPSPPSEFYPARV
jgi:hypothetical protein